MYRNYLFDLYGTLVDINTNEWNAELWENMAKIYAMSGAIYTPEELQTIYQSYVVDEKKSIPPEKYTTHPEPQILNVFRRLYTEKSVPCSDEIAAFTGQVFRALSLEYIRLYDGVDELFEAIRQHGGKIFLLSNAQRIFTEPEIRMLGIYDRFDDIMISSDAGCAKPDVKFYQRMLQKHHLLPEETIMIGNDYISDIKGSYDAGLDSLYLHTNISPDIQGTLLAKYQIMSGSLHEARIALFGE